MTSRSVISATLCLALANCGETPMTHCGNCSASTALAYYDDVVRLPIEAFGANWRVQVFRRGVRFPDQFNIGFSRASAAALLLQERFPTLPVAISFAPRTYLVRETITIDQRITLHGSLSGVLEIRSSDYTAEIGGMR